METSDKTSLVDASAKLKKVLDEGKPALDRMAENIARRAMEDPENILPPPTVDDSHLYGDPECW